MIPTWAAGAAARDAIDRAAGRRQRGGGGSGGPPDGFFTAIGLVLIFLGLMRTAAELYDNLAVGLIVGASAAVASGWAAYRAPRALATLAGWSVTLLAVLATHLLTFDTDFWWFWDIVVLFFVGVDQLGVQAKRAQP
ncbi:MAG TPA: hypothetical protein VMH36_06785 [Alphaproteobacteria bacterium]|nr:hypothetical protein [Alphaproteobacteria bacterium]